MEEMGGRQEIGWDLYERYVLAGGEADVNGGQLLEWG